MLPRRSEYKESSDSDDAYNLYESTRSANQPQMPLLMMHPGSGCTNMNRGFGGVKGDNYMVLQPMANNNCQSGSLIPENNSNNNGIHRNTEMTLAGKEEGAFTSLLGSINQPDGIIYQISANVLQFLNTPQRVLIFLAFTLFMFLMYPFISTILFGGFFLIIIGGFQTDDNQNTSRTVKWTVTSFSLQMKDGFLPSPAFVDQSGQWRLVIKQKKGMDGPQTSFGLMSTDIFPDVETVAATVTFYCTNQLGQEVCTGGIRSLTLHHEFQRAGDCGMTRQIRIPRRILGDHEVVIINCNIEFRRQCMTILRHLGKRLSRGYISEEQRYFTKKGKNVVTEHGNVYPGSLQFYEDVAFSPAFRPVFRFLQHPETKTFIWEIPAFTSLLETREIWGLYSPQFFLNSQDICAMWRMKLLEVQGVFRLHVQLRGLPQGAKQMKSWYLLQLVDRHGQSVIPEHAVARLKYPDHMNLWDTSRHILYRRETILEKFVGDNGAFSLRISLQMQPNDVSLMEVDSDEWIHNSQIENEVDNQPSRMLQQGEHLMIARH